MKSTILRLSIVALFVAACGAHPANVQKGSNDLQVQAAFDGPMPPICPKTGCPQVP